MKTKALKTAAILLDAEEEVPPPADNPPPADEPEPDPNDDAEDFDPKDFALETFTPELFLERLKQKLEEDFTVYNEPDIKYVNNYFVHHDVPDLEECAENWSELDELIEKYGDWVLEHADGFYFDADDTKKDIEDNYRGTYRSAGVYAEEFADSMGEIPSWVQPYVDWEKMGQDMLNDCTTYDHHGKIVVFGQ